MTGLDEVIGDITEQLDAEREAAFRKRLRAKLLDQPKEWLVDQLLARIGDTAPAGQPHDSDGLPRNQSAGTGRAGGAHQGDVPG